MKMIFTLKELFAAYGIMMDAQEAEWGCNSVDEFRDYLWDIPQDCRIELGISFSNVVNHGGKGSHWEINFEGNTEDLRSKACTIETALKLLEDPNIEDPDRFEGELKEAQRYVGYVNDGGEHNYGIVPLDLLEIMLWIVNSIHTTELGRI